MKRLLRLGTIVTLTVLLAAAGGWYGGRWILALSVAQDEGVAHAMSLAAPVEVSFDARGVPRIDAKTDADLYVATGWVHASERLFQMELVRRLARGELAEIFGEAVYETDAMQRRLGFARQAARDAQDLTPAVRAMLERYASGVNAWTAQTPMLPPEFVILRTKPRPWTVEDSLVIALYQTWYSHELMDLGERYQALAAKLGDAITPAFSAAYPWSPPTVPSAGGLFGGDRFPLRASQASNSWVVARSRSASGKAIHAADPHLSIDQIPGLWYLASLHSEEGLNVVGVMQPGLPFVVMGHNGAIAYSFTVASVDIIDTFEEAIDGSRVMTAGGLVPLETTEELIAVKGEKALRKLLVERTPNGPLIERNGNRGVSLHWAGFDVSAAAMIDAGMKLQRAASFEEFRHAVTRFGALDANWIYSDRDGNIGYQLGVPIPIRAYANTFARQPGSPPTSAWKGYRALDETPHALNPAQGWLASCNNQPVGTGWPYPLPGFYDPYRITRAASTLSANHSVTRDEAGAMQLELVSGRALRWKQLAADGAFRAGDAKLAGAIEAWNGALRTDSREAAIFLLWWQSLARNLFEDDLGATWKMGSSVQEQVLSSGPDALIDDRRTAPVESREDISALAMKDAIRIARGRTLAEISTLTVRHPLGRVKLLERWLHLSRGPVPIGGDLGSLNANFHSFDETSGTFRAHIGPSMRFVMDWSDPDAFTVNTAFGQSGNPLSQHYDDFFAASLAGERWTVPFSKEKSDASAFSRLRLEP